MKTHLIQFLRVYSIGVGGALLRLQPDCGIMPPVPMDITMTLRGFFASGFFTSFCAGKAAFDSGRLFLWGGTHENEY